MTAWLDDRKVFRSLPADT